MKRTKRFLGLVLSMVLVLLMVLPAVPAFAASIRLEGETYTRASVEPRVGGDGLLSNGQYLLVFGVADRNLVYEYDFEVEDSGMYQLDVTATLLGVGWTSDWTVWVNTEDNVPAQYTQQGSYVKTEGSATANTIVVYDLGTFYLKAGKNTIGFVIDPDDTAGANEHVCYLDCINVTQLDMDTPQLTNVKFSDREVGVFESTENISIRLEYLLDLTRSVTYDMQIVDAWGREVMRRDVTAGMGKQTTFLLGKFAPGWYQIFLRDKETDALMNDYFAFTVTHPYSECVTDYDSSIATDVAGEYDAKAQEYAEDLSHANKLLGFKWIRTRGTILTPVSDSVAHLQDVQHETGFMQNDSFTDYYLGLNKIKELDMYEIYKQFRDSGGGRSVQDMYEINNELDPFEMGDIYAIFAKVVAIALRDSGVDPYISLMGSAEYDTMFHEQMLQNGIMDYTNVYNFHCYGSPPKADYARRTSNAYSPLDNLRPLFCTEGGFGCVPMEDGTLSDKNRMDQARAAVKNFALLSSHGAEKWFWFLARAYIESGTHYGTYHHRTYQPYPASSTLANMTHQLGDALYRGPVANLPDGVEGYVYDDGQGNDAALFLSTNQNYIEVRADKIVYSDLFGYEEVKTADENGVIKLLVSEDPIFVKFYGRWDESNYYPTDYVRGQLEKLNFETNERVILLPVWEEQNYEARTTRKSGMILHKESTEPQHVSLRIYNLNDEPVSGTLEVSQEFDHFDIGMESSEFSLEPWGQTTIPITLTTSDSAQMGYSGDVLFSGKLSDGRELSDAVSRYWFSDLEVPIKEENRKSFSDFIYPESWDLTNICEPGIATLTPNESNKSAVLSVDHNRGYAQWFFSRYKVQNPEILSWEDADGIYLRRTCERASSDGLSCFLYMKDGREYFSGYDSAYPYVETEQTVIFTWDQFSVFRLPAGMVLEYAAPDPKDIEYVAIGVSGTSTDIPDMTIWDFGLFRRDAASMAEQPHMGELELSGVEQEGHYTSTEGLKLNITLPPVEIEEVRVINGTTPYTNWTRNGSQVEVDLSSLSRGRYIFYISAKNKFNYRYTKEVSFYVE